MYASSRPSAKRASPRDRRAALIPATSPCAAASSYPEVPLIWPARNRPGNPVRLERRAQLGRLDEVVLDRVARAQHHRVLEAGQRVNESSLDVAPAGSSRSR